MRTFPECGHTRHTLSISVLASFTSTKMGFYAVESTTRGCLRVAFLGKERKTDPCLQFLFEITTGKGTNWFGLGHMLIPGPVPEIWRYYMGHYMGYYNWPRQPLWGQKGKLSVVVGMSVHMYVCMLGRQRKKFSNYYYRYAQFKELWI